MSRNICEAYDHAVASATECGLSPGNILHALKADFISGDDAFALLARGALWRRIGLVKAEIVVDGPWFDVEWPHENAQRVEAWLMPIMSGDDVIDLVAFSEDGKHAGKVWRLVGACASIGLPLDLADRPIERALWIFRRPMHWLLHWLGACRDNLKWLEATETGPEAFAALVLDPEKVRWAPYRVERASAMACFEEILFGDSPELRDMAMEKMRLEPPPFPRLRSRKMGGER